MIDFPADFTKFFKFYGLKVCFFPKFLSLHLYSKWRMASLSPLQPPWLFLRLLLPELRKPCGLLATEETDVMVEVTRQWLPRLSGPVLLWTCRHETLCARGWAVPKACIQRYNVNTNPGDPSLSNWGNKDGISHLSRPLTRPLTLGHTWKILEGQKVLLVKRIESGS